MTIITFAGTKKNIGSKRLGCISQGIRSMVTIVIIIMIIIPITTQNTTTIILRIKAVVIISTITMIKM